MRDNGNKKEIVAFYSEFLFLFAVVGECGADDVKWFALYDASKALLLIGISAFFDRTAWMLGGGCIVGLFVLSILQYGAYHMTDYLIFIGMAYFFLVSSVRRWRWRKTGFAVLYKSSGLRCPARLA
jgi:hypothetical protein